MLTTLSLNEQSRYRRHIALPQIGTVGQEKLKSSSVLVVGLGGLGSPAALYLAAAGIGRLGLVDFDQVEMSNLQRQVLYTLADVGEPKLESAARRLQALNPHTEITSHPARFDLDNALDLIRGYDVVLDGTDAFSARYLVSDACVAAGIPDVFASLNRFEGQISVLAARDGPCYRCIFEEPPPPELVPSCADGGVLGVLPGLLGTLQATEAIKLLLGIGKPLVGRLLIVDALGMNFRSLGVPRNPDCSVCSQRPARPPQPRSPCSPPMATIPEISVRDYHAMRERGESPFLLDVRRPDEYEIANLGGSLIPLDELPERLGELESHRQDGVVVVHCRSGTRSSRAVELLRQHGFTNAVNLQGGILAWSDEVDPSVPKY